MEIGPLATAIAQRVAALVTIGETGEELERLVRTHGLQQVARASDLGDAVRRAASMAKPGAIVLLSPAFTSFDMFRDYEDRGRQFKAAVREELGR
jgi:UDP-N-acetylmuramoylalanine--D-glutamate ligase